MSRIPSDAIQGGRNFDKGAYRDDRYVRCGRCGYVANMDRHARASYGSKAGEGVSRTEGVNDFTITGGCPFCGALTFDKGAAS